MHTLTSENSQLQAFREAEDTTEPATELRQDASRPGAAVGLPIATGLFGRQNRYGMEVDLAGSDHRTPADSIYTCLEWPGRIPVNQATNITRT